MLLRLVLDQLQYGELSQVITGDSRGGGMTEASYPELFTHLNRGMVELHKRFNLRTDYVTLETREGIRRYELDTDYAVSNDNSLEPIKYIDDSLARFSGFLRIDWIKYLDVKEGDVERVTINDASSQNNVYMPSMGIIEPNEDDLGKRFQIHYRKMPDMLEVDDYEPETSEIDLPLAYLDALCLYVAACSFTPVDGGEDARYTNIYLQRFESECARLTQQGMSIAQDTEVFGGFSVGGWV